MRKNIIKSTLATMNLDKLKKFMIDGMVEYEKSLRNDVTPPDTIGSNIIETLANYWGYSDDFNNEFYIFFCQYINFTNASSNKNNLTKEIFTACKNRNKKDEFFKSEERTYKIHNGDVNNFFRLLGSGTTSPISEYRVSYPAGSFENQEIYEQYEQQTIENLGEILEILGPEWSFYLRIRGGDIVFNGRKFGLVPVAEIVSAKKTSGFRDDMEDLPAAIVLPVSIDYFCEVIQECATDPSVNEPTQQNMLIKKMIDSHFLNEELHKTLATKEMHQPVAKRASIKI